MTVATSNSTMVLGEEWRALESKALQELSHAHAHCAIQQTNKSGPVCSFHSDKTKGTIPKATKDQNKWNEMEYHITSESPFFAEKRFARLSAQLQASLGVGHDRTTCRFIRSLT